MATSDPYQTATVSSTTWMNDTNSMIPPIRQITDWSPSSTPSSIRVAFNPGSSSPVVVWPA